MFIYLIIEYQKKIFIIFIATLFLLTTQSNSYSEDDSIFTNTVEVEGPINVNFSRNKYIDQAFLKSFEILMSKVLLSKDLSKINDIKLNKIKNMINSFQILEEIYRKEKYKATLKVSFNVMKVKKFLGSKNISFSQPKKITAIFFPMLFINEEIQHFNENYFYNEWMEYKIENEIINFILPLEDLDDFTAIKSAKNKIEELDFDNFVNKYNTKNYAFTLMNYQNNQLNIYLKTKFNNSSISKNISYDLEDIQDEKKMNLILRDLKIIIRDIWLEENIINLSIPLSIKVKYKHKSIKDLNNLKNILYKINTIDNFSLDEFDINNSFFKIYYYGNPKKLRSELLNFNYELKDNQKQ